MHRVNTARLRPHLRYGPQAQLDPETRPGRNLHRPPQGVDGAENPGYPG